MLQKNLDKFIISAALAMAASTLVPIAKSTLRPIAASGLQGAAGLLSKAKTAVRYAREELEDIVAEAQFERMKKQMDKEIASLDSDAAKFH
jgi:hypothetical protein